jgi:hypothetical protein
VKTKLHHASFTFDPRRPGFDREQGMPEPGNIACIAPPTALRETDHEIFELLSRSRAAVETKCCATVSELMA